MGVQRDNDKKNFNVYFMYQWVYTEIMMKQLSMVVHKTKIETVKKLPQLKIHPQEQLRNETFDVKIELQSTTKQFQSKRRKIIFADKKFWFLFAIVI